jgi:mannose-binding lectin 2
MVNNGSITYDHDRDGTHSELAGCEARFRGVEQETFLLIRYENDVLTVKTDIESKNEWKDCFTVSGVRLPTGYHIGVSSATGELSDNHDIISIKTYELEAPVLDPHGNIPEDRASIKPSASIFAPARDHINDPPPPMSGVKLFFLIVLAIIGVVVLVAVGILVFQKKQETSRKRFY